MKKILTTIFCIVAAATLFAQVPQSFSFQAVMRNNDNTLMTNQIVHAKFTITPNDNSDVITYCETQNLTTDSNGILRAEIGKGTSCGGRFDQIHWERGEYLLNCHFALSPIPEDFITTSSQLISVPYALVSGQARSSLDWELYYMLHSQRLDTLEGLLNTLGNDIHSTDSIIRVLRASHSPSPANPQGESTMSANTKGIRSEMKREKSVTVK